jgi:hypothetical protein
MLLLLCRCCCLTGDIAVLLSLQYFAACEIMNRNEPYYHWINMPTACLASVCLSGFWAQLQQQLIGAGAAAAFTTSLSERIQTGNRQRTLSS